MVKGRGGGGSVCMVPALTNVRLGLEITFDLILKIENSQFLKQ